MENWIIKSYIKTLKTKKEPSNLGMVKKQHSTFGGLFLPPTLLKTPAFAGRQAHHG